MEVKITIYVEIPVSVKLDVWKASRGARDGDTGQQLEPDELAGYEVTECLPGEDFDTFQDQIDKAVEDYNNGDLWDEINERRLEL